MAKLKKSIRVPTSPLNTNRIESALCKKERKQRKSKGDREKVVRKAIFQFQMLLLKKLVPRAKPSFHYQIYTDPY